MAKLGRMHFYHLTFTPSGKYCLQCCLYSYKGFGFLTFSSLSHYSNLQQFLLPLLSSSSLSACCLTSITSLAPQGLLGLRQHFFCSRIYFTVFYRFCRYSRGVVVAGIVSNASTCNKCQQYSLVYGTVPMPILHLMQSYGNLIMKIFS